MIAYCTTGLAKNQSTALQIELDTDQATLFGR